MRAGNVVVAAKINHLRANAPAQLACTFGQRVRKTHPDGGANGDGSSPSKMGRTHAFSSAGSGISTDEINAYV